MTRPAYSKLSTAADMSTIQAVDAVAITIQDDVCGSASLRSEATNTKDAISFEFDWDRYQKRLKSEEIAGLYFLALSVFVGYLFFFFFILGPFGPFSLFLLFVTVLGIGIPLKKTRTLKTSTEGDEAPCPKTSIIPSQGLHHSCSGQQGNGSGYSILIPFSEVESILVVLSDKHGSRVTITTKATGDGAEYVQSGVPRFDTTRTIQVHSNSANAGENHPRPFMHDEKITFTIDALSEPFIFKNKMLEYMQKDPRQKLESLINRIDNILPDHEEGGAASAGILSKISDELKSLNESLP